MESSKKLDIDKQQGAKGSKNIKSELRNYHYWCLNWFYINKMAITAPAPVVKGMLKYGWIYDLLKGNSMVNLYTEGRTGANVGKVHMQLAYMIKNNCKMIQYALKNPKKVIVAQNLVPTPILEAMGLTTVVPELASVLLPKTDQYAGNRYLDAAESRGLPGDTCGLPRFTEGVALLNEVLPGKCIVASNLPCDGALASYEIIQQSLGNIPIYRLNVPYDFRNDESIDSFVEDLKGMIKFLEANSDGKMDWNKLREICGYYNELIEIEMERWELAKLEVPPATNDTIWFPHYWAFSVASCDKELVNNHKKLLKMDKKALEKGIPSFEGMKYRTIVWNPPPSGYGHMWNWLERCWGIGTVMDMETYGVLEHIDTSTPETMLKGWGKRYMWATMAKHTRGPAENMIGDLMRVIEEYKPDFVLFPAHVGCKNSMSMEAILKEQCKKINIPFCVFRYELLDNRVSSRQQMREQVSKFMTEVMKAEPIDPGLLVIDDSGDGKW